MEMEVVIFIQVISVNTGGRPVSCGRNAFSWRGDAVFLGFELDT